MVASWHVARRLLGGVIATLLVAAIVSAASPVGVYAAAGRYLDLVFSSVRVVTVLSNSLERNAMVGQVD